LCSGSRGHNPAQTPSRRPKRALVGGAVAEWAKDESEVSTLGSGDWGHWKEVSEEPPINNKILLENAPPAIVAPQSDITAAEEKVEGTDKKILYVEHWGDSQPGLKMRIHSDAIY